MRRWYGILFALMLGASAALAVPARVEPLVAAPGETAWWVFFDRADNRADALSGAKRVLSQRAIDRRVRVTGFDQLLFDRGPHPEDLEAVARTGARIRTVSAWLNGVSVLATDAQIKALTALPHLRELRPVGHRIGRELPPQTDSETSKNINKHKASGLEIYGQAVEQNSTIHVPEAHTLGYTGEGVLIGFLDAGYTRYETHIAYATLQVESTWDFVDGEADVNKDSHGFAVMGMAVANDTGRMVGVAPKAAVLLARTEDNTLGAVSEYPAEEDYWVAGLEWAERNGADLISSSLNYKIWYDTLLTSYTNADLNGDTAVTTRAADAAAARGLLVVNSMGNNGPGSTSLWPPADGDTVLAVGACTRNGEEISGYSGRGPTADGRIKPDVVAPGTYVYHPSTANDTAYSNYERGTSFSAPMVAGVVALMLEARPDLDPVSILGILHATASDPDSPDNSWGWGVVNAAAAVDSAINWPGPVGVIGERQDRLPVTPTLVSLYPNPTNGTALVRLRLPTAGALTLKVYDLLGRVLLERSLDVNSGEVQLELPLENAASGTYFVRAEMGTWGTTRRVVLLR